LFPITGYSFVYVGVANKNMKQKIIKYFKEITGNTPYTFQMEISEKILNDKNIIMQAPTGAGKTWASIMPFLIAWKENKLFPRKLIYSLPLRTLANSLYKEVKDKVEKFDKNINVRLQTGEVSEDQLFEGDIIFTTIDQSLSSLLSIPLSLSINQGNINAGAILSSYLIFDEFHLLDSDKALGTMFHLLKKFKSFTPFVLMSATLSNELLNDFKKELSCESVEVNVKQLQEIKSQNNKERLIHTADSTLQAEDIIKSHKNRSIVICNTVDKCRSIFKDLNDNKYRLPENCKIICLHSQFFQNDRKHKEEKLKEYFRRSSQDNAILISTQVIEVGIDISCEVMHTEISPINSFLQRVGRCARYEGEKGVVFVYDIDKANLEGEEKNKPYLPYDEKLCLDTLAELKKINGQNLDYFKSQEIIDHVLTQKEINDLKNVQSNHKFDDIEVCWKNPDRKYAPKLIREINAIEIVLFDKPEDMINPFLYDTVSMYRYSLIGKLKKIIIDENDWLIKIPKIKENSEDESSYYFDKYDYEIVSPDNECLKWESRIILNSKYIKYDENIGLNFENIGNEQSGKLENKNEKKLFIITKDTYQEHIDFMTKAYEKYFKDQLQYTYSKINAVLNDSLNFDEIVKTMFLFHDLGKLNIEWQAKAKDYQKRKNPVDFNDDEELAHMDYNPETDQKVKLPPHAGVGAVIFWDSCKSNIREEVLKSVFTAILKHHSVFTESSPSFNILGKVIDKRINLLKYDSCSYNDLAECLTRFDRNKNVFIYFAMVRILRQCDQKSFEIKDEIIQSGNKEQMSLVSDKN